ATLTSTDAAGNQTVGGTGHTTTYAVDNAVPTISVGPSVLSVTGGADASTVMAGSIVQIQFTLADTGSGPDTTITPKVTFAGNAATSCTPATNTFTCSYPVTGSETLAANGTVVQVIVSGYKDRAGNIGASNNTLPIPADF